MDKENPFAAILTASEETRLQVTQEAYDEAFRRRVVQVDRMPNRRRRRRIAAFCAAIGQGHSAILEMGCGNGDLTWSLVHCGDVIVGTDVSTKAIEVARRRAELWRLPDAETAKVQFRAMSAVQLEFPERSFDRAISTSMIEHLHPDDLPKHFSEVHRVLRPGGKYLIWCPNGLGHHGDRDHHFSMYSYAEWIDKMSAAGFKNFVSTRTTGMPLVNARRKVFLENLLSTLRVKLMWSHLGVRNVFLMGSV
jgi:cyclopropane fatty-acyl-phospholipid synthase-like methyltransferase